MRMWRSRWRSPSVPRRSRRSRHRRRMRPGRRSSPGCCRATGPRGPAELSRWMAERADAHLVEIDASHAVTVSQPGRSPTSSSKPRRRPRLIRSRRPRRASPATGRRDSAQKRIRCLRSCRSGSRCGPSSPRWAWVRSRERSSPVRSPTAASTFSVSCSSASAWHSAAACCATSCSASRRWYPREWYVLVAVAAALVGMSLQPLFVRLGAVILALDAVTIGLFGAIGASKALSPGCPPSRDLRGRHRCGRRLRPSGRDARPAGHAAPRRVALRGRRRGALGCSSCWWRWAPPCHGGERRRGADHCGPAPRVALRWSFPAQQALALRRR